MVECIQAGVAGGLAMSKGKFVLEMRYGAGKSKRLPGLARELVRLTGTCCGGTIAAIACGQTRGD